MSGDIQCSEISSSQQVLCKKVILNNLLTSAVHSPRKKRSSKCLLNQKNKLTNYFNAIKPITKSEELNNKDSMLCFRRKSNNAVSKRDMENVTRDVRNNTCETDTIIISSDDDEDIINHVPVFDDVIILSSSEDDSEVKMPSSNKNFKNRRNKRLNSFMKYNRRRGTNLVSSRVNPELPTRNFNVVYGSTKKTFHVDSQQLKHYSGIGATGETIDLTYDGSDDDIFIIENEQIVFNAEKTSSTKYLSKPCYRSSLREEMDVRMQHCPSPLDNVSETKQVVPIILRKEFEMSLDVSHNEVNNVESFKYFSEKQEPENVEHFKLISNDNDEWEFVESSGSNNKDKHLNTFCEKEIINASEGAVLISHDHSYVSNLSNVFCETSDLLSEFKNDSADTTSDCQTENEITSLTNNIRDSFVLSDITMKKNICSNTSEQLNLMKRKQPCDFDELTSRTIKYPKLQNSLALNVLDLQLTDSSKLYSIESNITKFSQVSDGNNKQKIHMAAETVVNSIKLIMYYEYDHPWKRLGILTVPKCCDSPYKCIQVHGSKSTSQEIPDYITQMLSAMMQLKNLHFMFHLLKIQITNACYPSSAIFHMLLEIVLCTESKNILSESLLVLQNILTLHPPCAFGMKEYYAKVFCLDAYENKSILHVTLKCIEHILIQGSDSPDFNELTDCFYVKYLQESYKSLSLEERMRRHLLVLQFCIDVLEQDLVVWLVKNGYNPRKVLSKVNKWPLVASVAWHPKRFVCGVINKRVIHILESCFQLPFPNNKQPLRLLNLVAEVIVASESLPKSYPYFGEKCKNLGKLIAETILSRTSSEDTIQLIMNLSPWLKLFTSEYLLQNVLKPFPLHILDIVYGLLVESVDLSQDDESPCRETSLQKNHKGQSILHVACRNNDLHMIKKMLSKPGIDPNDTDNAGNTPLLEAVSHGNLEAVNLLLKHVPFPGASRVDVYIKNKADVSPIEMALKNRFYEICRMLVDYAGSNLGIPSEYLHLCNCDIDIKSSTSTNIKYVRRLSSKIWNSVSKLIPIVVSSYMSTYHTAEIYSIMKAKVSEEYIPKYAVCLERSGRRTFCCNAVKFKKSVQYLDKIYEVIANMRKKGYSDVVDILYPQLCSIFDRKML